MAKKSKQQRKRSGNRSAPPPVSLTPSDPTATAVSGDGEAVATSVAEPIDSTGGTEVSPLLPDAPDITTPSASAPGRRVQRRDPAMAGRPGGRPTSSASALVALDPEDAAIPFDRVPYVPSDLRRVLIMAVIMLALIIVADVVVGNVVK